MKRDDDFLRELLFKIEEANNGFGYPLTMGATDEELKTLHHLHLLRDQGFICEQNPDVYRLTSPGHDYIDSIRDPGVWTKTKENIAKLGQPVTLSVIKDIATKILQGEF